MFGNITEWGPQAKEHLQKCGVDILLLAEHRRRGDSYREMQKDLGKASYATIGVEAEATDAGDTAGGVTIGFKSHLCISRYSDHGTEQQFSGKRWCVCHLRLQGAAVAVGVAYLHMGVEDGPENMKVLGQLGQSLSATGLPFIVAADWDMEASTLRSTGWLDRLGGEVVAIPGVESTCTAGSGRLIDFFVVSKRFAAAVQAKGQDMAAPWKPHAALILRLNARPRSIQILKHIEPKEIPVLHHSVAEGATWDQCSAAAALMIMPMPRLVGVGGRDDDRLVAGKLGPRTRQSMEQQFWCAPRPVWQGGGDPGPPLALEGQGPHGRFGARPRHMPG